MSGLERMVVCGDCGWVGQFGRLMARDVLRCPRCDSANVHFHISEAPEKKQ